MNATEARVSRRQLLRLSLLAGLGAVAAACAGRNQPGWTYGPTLAPPAGSPEPSATPGGSPTPAAESASPSASGAGVVIKIVAQNIKFDLAEFSVPANTPFQIVFDNQDAGIPHNVAIYDSGPGGASLFKGEIFNGVKTVTYDVPALPAGNHYFQCDVHPTMNGTVRAA
ncbi:MAG: cupredoxin domain-containing protein [Chloroflexi bacterium]|nr:cupredoxin domain-containing protein [Chloroflexota bacterium]